MIRMITVLLLSSFSIAAAESLEDLPEAWVINALSSQPYTVCYLKTPQKYSYLRVRPPYRLFVPARFDHGSRDTTVLLTSSITASDMTYLYYVPVGSRPDSIRVNISSDSSIFMYVTDAPPAPDFPAARSVQRFLENYDSVAVDYYAGKARLQDYYTDARFWDWARFAGSAILAGYGFSAGTDVGDVAGYAGSGLTVVFGIAAVRNIFVHRSMQRRSEALLDTIREWSFPGAEIER